MEKKDVAENARDAEVGPVHDNAKDRSRDKEIRGNKQIESVRKLPPSRRHSFSSYSDAFTELKAPDTL